MSSLIEGIKAKAKANKQHILLPEGEEERTVQAAAIIREQGLADVTLFGKPEKIAAIPRGRRGAHRPGRGHHP